MSNLVKRIHMKTPTKHIANFILLFSILLFATHAQEIQNTNKTIEITIPAIPNVSKPPEVNSAYDNTTIETSVSKTTQNTQKTIQITIPNVPKVPVVNSAHDNTTIETDRSIKFSKRTPPDYSPQGHNDQNETKSEQNIPVGTETQGRISAYLRGEFMDVKMVEEKLKAAGFEIVASVPVDKDGSLISVIYTDKTLVEMSSKENRGFMASLRILVDTKDKTINIMNPLYVAKGFLQKDFDETGARQILAKLLTQFSSVKNSKDTLKYQLLSNYQFMNGLPFYENMIEVGQGDNLLEKVKNNKLVLFRQDLKNGSTLIGIQIARRTSTFTKRIGTNNAAMLPYPVLIENGKAKILDPKYYIAFMYPLLTMSEFMTIASIPDAIIKDCEKVFK